MSGGDYQHKRVRVGVCEYKTDDQGRAGGILWLSGELELSPSSGTLRAAFTMPPEWRDIKGGKPTRAQIFSLTGGLREMFESCGLFDDCEDMASIPVLSLETNSNGTIVDSWIVTVHIEGGFDRVPQERLLEVVREAISDAKSRRALTFSRSIH